MVPPARACTRLVDSKSARFGRDAERALVGTGAWVGGSGRVPDGGSYASSTREPPPQHTHRLQVCQTHAPPSQHSAGCGSHGSARRASQYTHRYRCRSSSHPRVLCVHRWRDANPRSKGVTPLVVLMFLAVRQGTSRYEAACRIQEITRAAPNPPLSVGERCHPTGCPDPRRPIGQVLVTGMCVSVPTYAVLR